MSKRETVRAALARVFGRARTHAGRVSQAWPGARAGVLSSPVPDVRGAGAAAPAGVRQMDCATLPAVLGAHELSVRARVMGAGYREADGAVVRFLRLPAPEATGIVGGRAGWVRPVSCPANAALRVPETRDFGRLGVQRRARVVTAAGVTVNTKVRDGLLALCETVPLVRERRGTPAGTDAAAWAGELRATLAAACGADADDVQVAGRYPSVPIGLARHMALADGGRTLRVWLRPAGRAPVRLWTVTLGRVRSTGRAVQCAAEERNGA